MKTNILTKIVSMKELKTYKKSMWYIYKEYYDVEEELFYRRLQNYSKLGLFFKDRVLVGFCGFYININKSGNKKNIFIGVGSTSILKNYRRFGLLQVATRKVFLNTKANNLLVPIFLWAHASTFKSYLILANFPTHYPNRLRQTPKSYKDRLDVVGNEIFGEDYNSETGTAWVRGVKISDNSATLNRDNLRNENISFFHSQLIKAPKRADEIGVNGVLLIAPIDLKNLLFGSLYQLVRIFKIGLNKRGFKFKAAPKSNLYTDP